MPYEPNHVRLAHAHDLVQTRPRSAQRLRRPSRKKGLRGITITCHSPMPFGWNPKVRMTVKQLPQYVELVAATRAEYAGRVDVRLGMESDYLPGMESWLDELHCRADFSYVLGSVHPQTDEYRAMYLEGANRLEYEKSYFENLANAAESGLFDCLSHPDIVKIVHPSRSTKSPTIWIQFAAPSTALPAPARPWS